MNDLTRQNLANRSNSIRSRLGALAYERQDHVLKIEAIDKDVAAMEAQNALIDVTLGDLNSDLERETAEKVQREA